MNEDQLKQDYYYQYLKSLGSYAYAYCWVCLVVGLVVDGELSSFLSTMDLESSRRFHDLQISFQMALSLKYWAATHLNLNLPLNALILV